MINNDKEFEDFMDEEYGKNEESKDTNLPFFVTVSLREKAHTIQEAYSSTLKAYNNTSDEKLKNILEKHIKELIKRNIITIEQFDYLIADELTSDEDLDGNGNNLEETDSDEPF